jgi:4-cresol dehydrogenase (hydroxylating) flavoprotein subunit
MTATLPPTVSETAFSRAIDGFTAALGSDKVLTSDEARRDFRDPFQHPSSDDYMASAIVMPTAVEEVQAVVRIANEHRVPLWPHARGMNNGYGGPAPRVNGSVIVSMRNMNRVLEVNPESAYAVVEPGASWFDLYNAIREGGHDLWLSCADIGWGSVVGNSLDNGCTYLPYGQDFQAPCGMEIVLASGEVLRTGMGALPDSRAWHLYRRGLGPTLEPMFIQSNYGIVTKMGVWLLPKPQCYMPIWIRGWKDDDLGPMSDVMRELLLDRTIEGLPQILNTLLIASVVSDRVDWYDGDGPIPDDVIDRIGRELDIGRWSIRTALYADEPVVDYRFEKIKQAFAHIPGVTVWGEKRDPDEVAELPDPGERVLAGVPNIDINRMTAWYGGEEGGHIGFSPIAALTGRDALEVRDLLRRLVEEEAGLDYIAGMNLVNARSFVHVTLIIFDTKDEEKMRGAYDTAKLLVREAGKRGYGEYRAHIDFMDLASDQYSFNDNVYRRFCETIKDAVDPNGILAPGRHGVWPASMRR